MSSPDLRGRLTAPALPRLAPRAERVARWTARAMAGLFVLGASGAVWWTVRRSGDGWVPVFSAISTLVTGAAIVGMMSLGGDQSSRPSSRRPPYLRCTACRVTPSAFEISAHDRPCTRARRTSTASSRSR